MSRRRRRAAGGRTPAVAVVVALVGLVVFFVLPLLGLLWRAPWSDVGNVLGNEVSREALRLSLVCSLSATALSAVFGLPLAWVLARTEFRGRSIVRALAVLPLVLPPVVGGVALFYAFGRRGLVGEWLQHAFGWELPFTIWAAILAETFVAMPFFVITVEGALRSIDTRFEDAAATLGASRFTVMRRVTLPAIGPSIAAGLALTWARALGEFGATITFAGNFQGKTQTLPLAIYLAFENSDQSGIVLSLVLVAVSVLVLAVVGSRVFMTRTRVSATTT
ncbi:MAG TPA: ABC transporter permease [Acidimicrobiia bacterium]|nr:ABC transporter permease [Acidimicrobiia bacterium]